MSETNRNGKWPLPEGWVWTTLGDVALVQSGAGFPKAYQGKTHGELPFAKVSDISNAVRDDDGLLHCAANYISAADAKKLGAKVFPIGSTVFAKIGEAVRLNRRAFVIKPSLFDNNVMGLLPKESIVEPKFLFYFTKTFDLYEYSQATTVPSVRKSDVENIVYPLPPLPTQHRIVAEIEKQFTRLDAAVAALKRAKANLARYKAAVLKAAVEGRLVPQDPNDEPAAALLERILAERRAQWEAANPKKRYVEPKRPDVDGLPELPVGWVWATVEQLGEVRLGRQRSPKNHAGPNMRPYLRAANATWQGLDITDVMEMNFEPREFETYRLKLGDILLAEASGSPNEVGKSFIWKNEIAECAFQNTLIRVRLNHPLQPEYFHVHFFADALSGRLGKIAKGVGIHHLGAERLAQMAIALPPIEEQVRIAAEVERQISIIQASEQAINADLARAVPLRQGVLGKAFRGELVASGETSEVSEDL